MEIFLTLLPTLVKKPEATDHAPPYRPKHKGGINKWVWIK